MTLMQNLPAGGDIPAGTIFASTYDPDGTPLDKKNTAEEITKIVLSMSNQLHVDATKVVIPGLRYQSYSAAVVFIQGSTVPSYFNRWAVIIHGAMPIASPVLHPWIYPMGLQGKTALVAEGNWTNVGAETNVEAYMMFNLSTGGLDPLVNTTIQAWDCDLNDQETTVGTGTIWLKRTNLYDGDNNADLATCTLIVDDISQATIQDAGSVICYGAYYLTVNGTSIGYLQTYGAGGQIYFNNNVSIGGCYIFGAEIYGVDFSLLSLMDVDTVGQLITGGRLKKLITAGQPFAALVAQRIITITSGSNQIINTILYDLDVIVDGGGTTVETVGSMHGIDTESITEANGGTWVNRGDIFDDRNSAISANNTQDAIELLANASSIVLGIPPSNLFTALQSSNGDAGPFTDVTANFQEGSPAQAILPGVAINSSIYIGFDKSYTAIDFFNKTQSLNLGAGTLTYSYWDGVAWTVLDCMETNWDFPHNQDGQDVFMNNTNFSIRTSRPSDWALKVLDGINKFWLELKVTVAITTVPIVDWFQVEQDRIRIDSGDGHVEYFGQARPLELINIQNFYDLTGFNSTNTPVDTSPNTQISLENNTFGNSAHDAIGNKFTVPIGVDTSMGLIVQVKWAPGVNNVGDIEWELFLNIRPSSGSVLDGTGMEITVSEIDSILAATNDIERFSLFLISIADADPDSIIQWGIHRDATGGNPDDTYPGPAYITDINILIARWK